ncbi:hypothetical protein Tco_0750858 [Tanacetum coccineum]|uniref:Uncharacterized protein n=1 Tax=Tanacetum coccineum TaxID=301880 RepID=A0ABQ4Z386_9ASTR
MYSIVGDDIKKRIDVKSEGAQIILTGIDNDIYSTVDTYLNAKEIWIAIERLMQGENINKQDVETNLFWECGKEIAKALSPPSELEHKVVSDEEET